LLDGRELGHRIDPQLTRAGQGGALTHPSQFSQLPAYRLPAGSPLARAGLDLQTLFGLAARPPAFLGAPLVSSTLPVRAASPPLASSPAPARVGHSLIRRNFPSSPPIACPPVRRSRAPASIFKPCSASMPARATSSVHRSFHPPCPSAPPRSHSTTLRPSVWS